MYRLKISYDKVRGQWSLKLSKKWWILWLPEVWIWTSQHYTHNSDYKRWMEELKPIVIKSE